MNSPAPYLHVGFVLISLSNLFLIVFMLILFAVALIAPFPHRIRHDRRDRRD